jgi:tetratricopeptide (TPR) repeat protein
MGNYFERAELLYEQGRYELAIAELHRELALDPNASDSYFQLGRCLTALKHYEEAIPPLNKALSLDPDRNDYHHALAHCYFSHYVLDNGDRKLLDKAKIPAKEAIRLAPEEPQHIFLKAMILCEEGKRWEIETSVEREIHEIFNPPTQNAQAIACWEESLELLAEARRLDPEEINYLNQQIFLLEKLNRSSDSMIEEAIALAPNDPLSLNSYGWMLLERGEYIKAAGYFQDALRFQPSLEPAKNGLLESLRSRIKMYRWVSATHRIPNTKLSISLIGIALFFGAMLISFLLTMVQRSLQLHFHDIVNMSSHRILMTIGGIGFVWFLTSLVAQYIFNWFLQFDRYSKQLIEQYDIIRAAFIGVVIVTSIGFFITTGLSPTGMTDQAVEMRNRLSFIAMFVGIGLLPIAITPSVVAGKRRRLMAVYTLATWVIGLIAIGFKIDSASQQLESFPKMVAGLYILAILASPIVAIRLNKNAIFVR